MRYVGRLLLIAGLVLPALPCFQAEAATQVLGLVASNGAPTPLQCQGGICRGFFASFCLQQYRPSPIVYSEYRVGPVGALTLVARRADGSAIRLPAGDMVAIRTDIDFSSVIISVPESELKALGAVSASIEVAPLTSVVPAAVAGDPSPQSPEEIAYATGMLRRLAQRSFEDRGANTDAARVATFLVNTLPAQEPTTAAGRRNALDRAVELAGGKNLDPAAVSTAAQMLEACAAGVEAGASFDLRLCMKLHQTDMMSTFNRDFWERTGGS